MNATIEAGAGAQYLTFFVGGEEYAVEILRVREVIEALPVTRVPNVPAAIRGVVNVRGTVVPTIDLGVRFGGEEIELTRYTCIVIIELEVEGEPLCMGLLVERVSQVLDLDDSLIEDVPAFGVPIRLDFLRGMGRVGEKFVMILDSERVVETTDLLATTSALVEGAAADVGAPPAPAEEVAR
jgi:purine-binding chemotaxis protein CheW